MVKKIIKEFGDEVSHLSTYTTPGTPGQGIVCPNEGEEIQDPVVSQLGNRNSIIVL